jgi:hypothetical protein
MRRRVFFAALIASAGLLGLAASFASADTSELVSKGWSKPELVKILTDFEALYRGRLSEQFSYRMSTIGSDEFDVHFPGGIPHPLLAWLVNYVQYPKGFNLGGREISVLGRVTLTTAYPIPSADYVGTRARIYVPSNDRDFDLVYVAVGSEYFRQSFTNDRWEREADGRVPERVKALW